MKKFFAKLHLWLAVPFGIVITVLCLTGAILVFESELKDLTEPSLYKASRTTGEVLPFAEIMARSKAQLPDTVALASIQIPSSPGRNYRLGLAGGGRTTVMVDPYTGEVAGVVRPYEKGKFFTFIRRFHRWFLFENRREGISWGKMVTGTSTLVFVVILLSGIVIWIPKTLAGLKKRLSVKRGVGRFRFWYDFHLSFGKMASLFLLVMALTGLTWSFDWYRNGFYKVFGVEVTQGGGGHGAPAGQAPATAAGHGEGRGSERSDGGNETYGPHGNREEGQTPVTSGNSPEEHSRDAGREGRSAGSVHPAGPARGEETSEEGISHDVPRRNGEGRPERPAREDGPREEGIPQDSSQGGGDGRPERPAREEGPRDEGIPQESPQGGKGRPEGPVREGGRPESSSDEGSRGGHQSPSGPGWDGNAPDSENRQGRGGRGSRPQSAVDYSVWQAVAERLRTEVPRFRTITVQDGTASVATNRYGNTRASDIYTFHPATGEVTAVSYYRDQPRSAKIRGWIYAVHVGSWGGIYTKILYFLACLTGAALPVTGYYIWLKKRWKKWTRGRIQ
ncbi:MAG: PepSY domain-containing protein [Alistipes sp.]|nr:PepSY domain-containing protein [Alistipes sp.]